ncbi:energy-coupling factor ABC transporter permease [Sedimentitalea sp. JM2-8]|uniref:Energy-coupling factor ABC transporter permease n=1 Tax=Sedimentitalea xiamensis TaxID=3050037 RepID=A0ABT7FDI4_9RHOB|nr:energy-coupling factor ABC transporter permease [Sedimentitalea xiamensis]MDK3073178.1 energy-coupling factor ABC transporter permease [Sedimentitalea xiamensis]
MHIEPGTVHGAKMALAVATATGAAGVTVRLIAAELRTRHVQSLAARSLVAMLVCLMFFEVFPHVAVGLSEVHFILGTSLLLILGVVPAAVGLAGALGLQGLFFAPPDLPKYAVNVTTLLLPLFTIRWLARKWLRGTGLVEERLFAPA